MKPSRCIAFVTGYFILVSYYTGLVGCYKLTVDALKILACMMVIVSMCSLLAYNCHFHDVFTQAPEGYMFHLLYFRSHHCDGFVDWSLLGIENVTTFVEPQMPHEIELVTRTFWIAVGQLIANGLLVVTAASMLASTHFYWLCKSRRLTYQLFFTPLNLVFLATIFVDMMNGAFFSIDRFRSQSIDGTMTLLEVSNRLEARPMIEQIEQHIRAFAPNVMLYVSLKGIIGLILNICVLFFLALTGWEVVDGSKRKAAMKFITQDDKKSMSTVL